MSIKEIQRIGKALECFPHWKKLNPSERLAYIADTATPEEAIFKIAYHGAKLAQRSR